MEDVVEKLEYPYVRRILYGETLAKRFNEIRKFHPPLKTTKHQPEIENMPGVDSKLLGSDKYQVLVERMTDHKRYTELVDVFLEDEMIKAHWQGQPSLLETFNEHQAELVGKDLEEQRQILYSYTKPISKFRPTTMISLIKMYRPKYILDWCAGFGHRLLGALAYSDDIKYYCGIDPNRDLFQGYEKMINFFTTTRQEKSKYEMICGCAEEVKIPDPPNKTKKYDLIVTSPPYYDLEIYSNNSNQSCHRYKNLEEWYQQFLLKATKASIAKLAVGGYLIISINDKADGQDSFVERYVRDLNAIVNLRSEGAICVTSDLSYQANTSAKGCQPLWVWQKVCEVNM